MEARAACEAVAPGSSPNGVQGADSVSIMPAHLWHQDPLQTSHGGCWCVFGGSCAEFDIAPLARGGPMPAPRLRRAERHYCQSPWVGWSADAQTCRCRRRSCSTRATHDVVSSRCRGVKAASMPWPYGAPTRAVCRCRWRETLSGTLAMAANGSARDSCAASGPWAHGGVDAGSVSMMMAHLRHMAPCCRRFRSA